MWCENSMRFVRYCGGTFCYHHFLAPWSWIVMLLRYSQPQPWDTGMEGSFNFLELWTCSFCFYCTTWGVSRYLISHTLPVWPCRLSPLTLEVAGEFDDIPANKFAQCSGGRTSPISHPGKNLYIIFFEVSRSSTIFQRKERQSQLRRGMPWNLYASQHLLFRLLLWCCFLGFKILKKKTHDSQFHGGFL